MKKLLFLTLLLALTTTLFSQNTRYPDVKKGKCLTFSGSIGEYPVTLIMEIIDNEVSGRYYYNRIGQAIEFNGTVNDSQYILESLYGGDVEKEVFVLNIHQNELLGTWQKQEKKLSVTLTQFINPITVYQVHKNLRPNNIKNEDDMREAHVQIRVLWPEDASVESHQIRQTQYYKINNMQYGAEDGTAVKFEYPVDQRTIQGNPAHLIHQLQHICDYISDDFVKQISDSNDIGFGNRDFVQISKFRYVSDRYTVIQDDFYEYTGGAHGMYGESHETWDKSLNKLATIDDYYTKKQQKSLPTLMTQQYKLQNKIPAQDKLTLHGLWIEKFDAVGDDIYFTDLGFTTSFGLYEIAPYSEGIISVFVPWGR
jgi:hypothetical protein